MENLGDVFPRQVCL